MITLAIDDWLFEQLMIFDAGAEELEDGGDAEPDDDAEGTGSPARARALRLSPAAPQAHG